MASVSRKFLLQLMAVGTAEVEGCLCGCLLTDLNYSGCQFDKPFLCGEWQEMVRTNTAITDPKGVEKVQLE